MSTTDRLTEIRAEVAKILKAPNDHIFRPALLLEMVAEAIDLITPLLALDERVAALEAHRHQIPAIGHTMQYTTRPVGFGSKPGSSK